MVVIDEHDLGKTKIQLLMDLLYESTGQRIPEHRIKYFEPSELDARPDVPTDPNTFIPIRIDPTYDYNLSQLAGFLYCRRELASHFAGIDLELEFTEFPTTLHEVVLNQINPQLTYPLDCTDFVDYEITDVNTTSLNLVAKKGSFIWIGKASVAISPPDTGFYILVDNPYLTGFNPYTAPPP